MNDLENKMMLMAITPPDSIVLEKVFQHLEKIEDRYKASLVNKAWSRAFRSPGLWQKLDTSFASRLLRNKESLLKYLESFGQYLEELDIDCEWIIFKQFTQFLEIMTTAGTNRPAISLQKLVLTNVMLSVKKDARRRTLVSLLSNFLETQRNLTHFAMRNCRASVEEGIHFLKQLAKNNSRSLKNLHLVDFFSRGSNVLVCHDSDYLDVMGSFDRLAEFHVSYVCLNSDVLRVVVENCSSSLRLIKIYCTDSRDRKDHLIPDAAWRWVKIACSPHEQSLRVLVDMRDIENYANYAHIIPSADLMHGFTACVKWESSSCDQDNNIGLDALLNKLATHETLTDVTLDFAYNRSFDDRLLIKLVTCCPELKSLVFVGVLSDETKQELYEMQMDDHRAIKLKTLKLLQRDGRPDPVEVDDVDDSSSILEFIEDVVKMDSY